MDLSPEQKAELADPRKLACGPGESFCRNALKMSYDDVFTQDECAIATYSQDQDSQYNYWQWQPKYASTTSRGNAFLNSSVGTNRFARKQVLQESFLQARGQVTSSKLCQDSYLTYLPKDQFDAAPPAEGKLDMSLYPQNSVVKRSCASLTETNMLDRVPPAKGSNEGAFRPFPGADRRVYVEGQTLSTKRYASFSDLKAQQEALR